MPYPYFLYRRWQRLLATLLALALLLTSGPLQGGHLFVGPSIASAAPTTPQDFFAPRARPTAGLSRLASESLPAAALALATQASHQADAPLGATPPMLDLLAPAGQAEALANPLSVSLLQSAYHVGGTLSGTLVLTLTVHNNLAPATLPPLDPAATLTETLAALASDPLADANTVRNVLLSDTLLGGASFLTSQPAADHDGAQLAWNLGDIAPMGHVTATVALQLPAPILAPIALDTGATAWGTLQGRPVSAQTCPATLAPDTVSGEPVAPWLQGTVEADPRDPAIVQVACRVGRTPTDKFAYVRDLDYEAYKGSLRGARGTQWSQAGNSLDQSSLLIAMLRSSGVPARYRHGTLSDERARELILSMFPTTGAVVGYVPAGTPLSDPANDARLLAEVKDHWWVEAYLDGGWSAMDPSFRYASPGQSFADPIGPPLATIPDTLRHTVTVSIESESYHMLSYLNAGLEYATQLEASYTTAELVGQPLTLQHRLVRETPPFGCLIFCWVRYTYTPYLRLGDNEQVVQGHSFWELLSNYPFGQYALTGEWLHFDVHDAEGNTTRYTRSLGDRIGAGPRTGELRGPKMIRSLMTAEVLSSFGPGADSISHELDSHAIYFNPSWMASAHAAAQARAVLTTAQAMPALPTEAELTSPDLATRTEAKRRAIKMVLDSNEAFNRSLGASYVAFADDAARLTAPTGLVRAYPDGPRITIASTLVQAGGTVTETGHAQLLDLLSDGVRVIAYPGQARSAEAVYRMARGINDTFLETQVGTALAGSGRGASTILEAAGAQSIPLVYIDAAHLEGPDWGSIATPAKAHMLAAIKEGYGLIVPQRMVRVGGEPTIAWWQLDLETGEMIGVGADGTHQFLVWFAKAAWLLIGLGSLATIILLLVKRYQIWRGAASYTWYDYWQRAVQEAATANPGASQNAIYTDALRRSKEYMQNTVWPDFDRLCGAENSFGTCGFLK